MGTLTPRPVHQYIWDFITLKWVRQSQSDSASGASDVDIASDSVGLARQAQFPTTIGQKTIATSLSVALASDQAINFVNEVWPTVVSQGQGFETNTAMVTLSGTSEREFFLLRNPSGSGKTVRIKDLLYFAKGSNTQNMIYRMYDGPTITAVGTALTIHKLIPSQTQASVMNAYLSPTTSSFGTFRRNLFIFSGSFIRDFDLALYLEANSDLLITAQPSINNMEASVGLKWAEV